MTDAVEDPVLVFAGEFFGVPGPARVRAVENRRWLLRDTNNGYTESIDPYGRTAAQLPLDIRSQLTAPYDFRGDLTPYVRFGDWFSWLCIIVTAILLGLSLTKNAGKRAT